METEDLVLNKSSERKIIKEISKVLPDVLITVFAHALLVETVNLGDGSTFVVSAKKSYTRRVPYLQSNHQRYCFYTVVAAVDVITKKQVVCVWKFTADTEKLQKIMELAVHITSNGYRAIDRLNIVLIYQNFFCLYNRNEAINMKANEKKRTRGRGEIKNK